MCKGEKRDNTQITHCEKDLWLNLKNPLDNNDGCGLS